MATAAMGDADGETAVLAARSVTDPVTLVRVPELLRIRTAVDQLSRYKRLNLPAGTLERRAYAPLCDVR